MSYSAFLPFGRRADERFFSPDPLVISWILKSMSVFPSSPVRLLENEGFFFSPFFLAFPLLPELIPLQSGASEVSGV